MEATYTTLQFKNNFSRPYMPDLKSSLKQHNHQNPYEYSGKNSSKLKIYVYIQGVQFYLRNFWLEILEDVWTFRQSSALLNSKSEEKTLTQYNQLLFSLYKLMCEDQSTLRKCHFWQAISTTLRVKDTDFLCCGLNAGIHNP